MVNIYRRKKKLMAIVSFDIFCFGWKISLIWSEKTPFYSIQAKKFSFVHRTDGEKSNNAKFQLSDIIEQYIIFNTDVISFRLIYPLQRVSFEFNRAQRNLLAHLFLVQSPDPSSSVAFSILTTGFLRRQNAIMKMVHTSQTTKSIIHRVNSPWKWK